MPFTLPRDKIKDMVEIVYNRNCVYQTAYHVIWCPKYRKRILKGEIAEALRLAITAICIEREWPILTLEIQPDHIHLFVTIPPSQAVADAVKILKGSTARKLFVAFPALKDQLYIWTKLLANWKITFCNPEGIPSFRMSPVSSRSIRSFPGCSA